MAKGYSGGFPGGGMNMNNLMKQAQKMQKQMEEAQEALANQVFEVSAGGGAVKVTINGQKEIKEVTIDKDVVDPDDVEMLQDLILTVMNEAIKTVEKASTDQMGKITGGMGLPGGMF